MALAGHEAKCHVVCNCGRRILEVNGVRACMGYVLFATDYS